MSAPAVIDLSVLLAPIEGAGNPSGEDPRADGSANSLYYRIRDARQAARAIERTNLDPDALVAEPWQTVRESGLTLIASHAKDLEVAAWLTEALVRIDGFAGLRDGLLLLQGLADGFWETAYPLADEDDDGNEGRVSAVAGLNGSGAPGTIAQTIRTLPLVGIARPMSIWNYDQANEIEKITDKDRKAARLASGATSMEAFRESLVETPASDLHTTLLTIEETQVALTAMGATFDRVAGFDSPSTSALRDLIDGIVKSIRFFGAEKIAAIVKANDAKAAASQPEAVSADVGAGVAIVDGVVMQPAVRTGGFASREEALDAVLKLAEYFEKTEPQAPISYTLIEAVRRARLTLPELLTELSSDPNHIAYFRLAAGMRAEDSGATVKLPAAAPAAPAPAPEAPRSSGGW